MCQRNRLFGLLALAALVTLSAPRISRGQVPSTDIWLAELKVVEGVGLPAHSGKRERHWADGITVGTPWNITRRTGYDNQPRFTSDSRGILYVRDDESGRTDIYRYDIRARESVRITETRESEYSPTPVGRRGGFCAVRVEADSTQRLWRFDSDGSKPRVVLAAIDSVGYFAWVDDRTVALFVVGDPHTLRLVDVETQRETIIAEDIGRALLRDPHGDLTFALHQPGSDPARYAFYTWSEGTRTDYLIDAHGPGQDAVWVGDVLVMADGSKLYGVRPFRDRVWIDVVDLERHGVGPITRIAVSPDRRWIALVAAESR